MVPTLHATDYGVAGEAPALYDISSISNSDLAHVIPIAIIVIGVLLALVMRSLVAPLYLIASVALSYFAALGLAVILFIELGELRRHHLHPAVPVVYLPARARRGLQHPGHDQDQGGSAPLCRCARRCRAHVGVTGTTVTSAGLVLAGTFAVFAVVGGRGSGGSQIMDVGIGLAVGVIMDTFVVRTVLVPCTVVLLGRWNWWPSKITVDEPAATDAVSASADALGLGSPDSAVGDRPAPAGSHDEFLT